MFPDIIYTLSYVIVSSIYFRAVTIETNVFTPLTSDIVVDDLLTNISYLQWKLCYMPGTTYIKLIHHHKLYPDNKIILNVLELFFSFPCV
jgi:hypothetical protein